MLTNKGTKISCPLDPSSPHITGGAGAGRGRTSEVFIDVTSSFNSDSSNTVSNYLDNIIEGKNTFDELKTILKRDCSFNWNEIEPKLKELVIDRCNVLAVKAEKMIIAYEDGKSNHNYIAVADKKWAKSLEQSKNELEADIAFCLIPKGVGCTFDDLIKHFKSLNKFMESVPQWVKKILIESDENEHEDEQIIFDTYRE